MLADSRLNNRVLEANNLPILTRQGVNSSTNCDLAFQTVTVLGYSERSSDG